MIKNLGLSMGIFNIKPLNDTLSIWLEINPQGEFLFIEGMTGLNLISSFSKFLYTEAKKIRNI